jgi:hypothetical protein
MNKKTKILRKTIPLWTAILLLINSAGIVGILEYYIMKKNFNRQLEEIAQKTKDPKELIRKITREVIPAKGYTTALTWGDLGKQLVEAGAIDKEKYKEIFNSPANGEQEMDILEGNSKKKIAINENNSRFIVNTLWALGLTNKSKVLNEGPMRTGETPTKDFASTGGWTLGGKPVMKIYSSKEIIPLTDKQQDLVAKIAKNVYRPCCGNHTYFPDCNHGMAALGYIELAVARGLSESQIYKDLLAFNSFWFPTTYVKMAVYFNKEKNLDWRKVDPKLALSFDYSSAQGAQKISQAVANVPGIQSQGGSCGA